MAYKSWEMALGGVVLISAVGFAAFAVRGAGMQVSQPPGYTLTGSFRSAEGVRAGTEVRIAGVRVGQVTRMDLNPDSFRADVEIRITDRLRLPTDSTLAVASEGLLGGTFLEILPGGMPFDLEPGGKFEDTQSSVGLVQLLLRAFAGGSDDAPPADPFPADPDETQQP